MDHFVNLETGAKFLFDDEVYVALAFTVFANFSDSGDSLVHDVFNVVRLADGSLEYMQADAKVVAF